MSVNLTRPIIGIENRTAQEVFDIMVARIGACPSPLPSVMGWKAVPAEATRELLDDCNGKPVLCYENGTYYNAWIEFEPLEGGYVWLNDADSEPNPSHYCQLPAAPEVQL